jgi:hypothetical protein
MPDPTLQATALRYAAGDLTPEEVAAFEARLAEDQDARDALAEAVRLSAQAIGQKPPAPHPSFRTAIRARLNLRVYRGGPLAWVSLGAAAVAACTIIGLALAGPEPGAPGVPVAAAPVEARPAPPAAEPAAPPVVAPQPVEPEVPVLADQNASSCSVAEIWADLSNHESMEKARDDELRWRHRVRDRNHPHVSTTVKAAAPDVREP